MKPSPDKSFEQARWPVCQSVQCSGRGFSCCSQRRCAKSLTPRDGEVPERSNGAVSKTAGRRHMLYLRVLCCPSKPSISAHVSPSSSRLVPHRPLEFGSKVGSKTRSGRLRRAPVTSCLRHVTRVGVWSKHIRLSGGALCLLRRSYTTGQRR